MNKMNKQPQIVAVVTAGGKPKAGDPLAEYTQDRPKALVSIAGKPMITYVVDALAKSQYIQAIIVVALDPAAEVEFATPVEHRPDAGDLLGNVKAGLDHAMERYPDLDAILLSSSDVPTITPSIVDDFIAECLLTDHDLYYSVVKHSVMESRFPGSHRSYIHLREGDFAGGDVMLVRPGMILSRRDLWGELAQSRKNALRQARLVGLWTFLKLITRRLSLAEAEHRACKVLGVHGRAIISSHAEVGMDVDKPSQLEIVRADMESRTANASR
mgnify:CR=1 FL=1